MNDIYNDIFIILRSRLDDVYDLLPQVQELDGEIDGYDIEMAPEEFTPIMQRNHDQIDNLLDKIAELLIADYIEE